MNQTSFYTVAKLQKASITFSSRHKNEYFKTRVKWKLEALSFCVVITQCGGWNVQETDRLADTDSMISNDSDRPIKIRSFQKQINCPLFAGFLINKELPETREDSRIRYARWNKHRRSFRL
jgi:hypothetical protein